MLENKCQFETDIVVNEKSQRTKNFVAFSVTIYCKFTVDYDYERILKSVDIWRSYRQEN